jgi:hypothetical protein
MSAPSLSQASSGLVRPAGELLADPDVARLYLGGHAAAVK